ncbi:MAG: right-handed parallel beta-helix repeat-containing protein, partial [Bacteroidota bacterium]
FYSLGLLAFFTSVLTWGLNNRSNELSSTPVPTQSNSFEQTNAFFTACDNGFIFVDADAAGGGDGIAWGTAYNKLQDALDEACGCANPVEIWVAEGTYYPDEGVTPTDNDISSTFQLCNNVEIYGGFDGNESMLSERDFANNVTILSGDIEHDNGGMDDPFVPVVSDGTFPFPTDHIKNSGVGLLTNANHVVTGSSTDNSAVLDGFTVTGGQAHRFKPSAFGGGVYIIDGAPTLRNLIIQGNFAEFSGSGMFCENTAGAIGQKLKVENCDISYNGSAVNTSSSSSEGGIELKSNIDAEFSNCNILANINDGIVVENNSSCKLINCRISGNSLRGFSLNTSSTLIAYNCLFSGNQFGSKFNANGNAVFTNCTIVDGFDLSLSDPGIVLRNCIIPGFQVPFNSRTDITYYNSIVPNSGGSDDWNINCLFSGNQFGSKFNAYGNAVFTNCTIVDGFDLSLSDPGIVLRNCIIPGFQVPFNSRTDITYYNSIVPNSGGSDDWNINFGLDGGNNKDIDPKFVNALNNSFNPTIDGDYRLRGISEGINMGDNTADLDDTGSATETIADVSTDLGGNARIQESTVDIGAFEQASFCNTLANNTVVYVNHANATPGDGTSWATAFDNLQDALETACCCPQVTEIWVAQGTYYPDEGRNQTDDDRSERFELCNNVAIYGGFDGTETMRSERDFENNVTILSGDIDQDDDPFDPDTDNDNSDFIPNQVDHINGGNAYTVVLTLAGIDNSARIDGFTVTAGFADRSSGPQETFFGGGMYNRGNPTIDNCIFIANHARSGGGGLANLATTTIIINNTEILSNSCISDGGGVVGSGNFTNTHFENNRGSGGGGLYVNVGEVNFESCEFIKNTATTNGGGAIHNNRSIVTVQNSSILENIAETNRGGGGIYSAGTTSYLFNVTISGNQGIQGGGIFEQSTNPTIVQCIISGNKATNSVGGGIYSTSSSTTITNSVISGNSAASSSGGGLYCNFDVLLQNSIIWNNEANGNANSLSANVGNTFRLDSKNSIVQFGFSDACSPTWLAGTDLGGSKDMNPLFLAPLDPASAPQTGGDFRVQGNSPAVNMGDNTADLDGSGANTETIADIAMDFADNTRIQETTVDIGAFEILQSSFCPTATSDLVAYVDADNNTPGDGLSWANAFDNLQDALQLACLCSNVTEIWVAEGTYYPDEGGFSTDNDRNSAFELCDNVAIYGGFAGNESNRSDRDFENNVTILSGDLEQDDDPFDLNTDSDANASTPNFIDHLKGNNAFHVVLSQNNDNTAILDGFTITGGKNELFFGNSIACLGAQNGAGIYAVQSSPTLSNCIITTNETRRYGAGIFTTRAVLNLTNVDITYNWSSWSGGAGAGIWAEEVDLNIDDSEISNNLTAGDGGGISHEDGILTIDRSTINSNEAQNGGGLHATGQGLIISNSTLGSNIANAISGQGGGIYSETEVSLENVELILNVANSAGGGLYFREAGTLTINGSKINGNSTNNTSTTSGGGLYLLSSNGSTDVATITNSFISGNTVPRSGGGLYADRMNSIVMYNTVVSGNNAGTQSFDSGAGLYFNNSTAVLTNMTFSGNKVTGFGAALYRLGNSRVTAQNIIIWNNEAGGMVNNAAAAVSGGGTGSFAFANSIVAGSGGSSSWSSSFGTNNGGNKDVDPLFITPVVLANVPTVDGDLDLTGGSPAINMGDKDADLDGVGSETETIGDISTDLGGDDRVQQDVIDIGAYEEEQTISCPSGSNLVAYVDADNTTPGDGLSWANAFDNLQDALTLACNCSEVTQIWVAEGTYYPDEGAMTTPNDRNSTFQLCNNVALYGGFNGTESMLSERDFENNVTILSGDIDQDDDAFEPEMDSDSDAGTPSQTDHIKGNNAYHVLNGSGVDNTAILDGFSISSGNANGPIPNGSGGGMLINSGSPIIDNCVFSGNNTIGGGGGILIFNTSSTPSISNSTFSDNSSVFGGGIEIIEAAPIITACLFEGNFSETGGGISMEEAAPLISNSIFSGNKATGGAGLANSESQPFITSCIFSGNIGAFGGGVSIEGSSGLEGFFINCIFSGNTANAGGGIAISLGTPVITNSVFSGNKVEGDYFGSSGGGGIYNGGASPKITNTIIWNNQESGNTNTPGASIFNEPENVNQGLPASNPQIAHSIIANSGGSDSWNTDLGQNDGDNKDEDPLFVDPINPASAPTTDGNFSILPTSPAINMGDNDADLDGSGIGTETISDIPTDLAENTRILEGIVDIGAYEVLSPPPCGPEDSFIDLAAATYYIQPCEETTDFIYSFLINDPCGVPDDFNFFEDVTGNRGGLGINGSSHEVRENSIYVEL